MKLKITNFHCAKFTTNQQFSKNSEGRMHFTNSSMHFMSNYAPYKRLTVIKSLNFIPNTFKICSQINITQRKPVAKLAIKQRKSVANLTNTTNKISSQFNNTTNKISSQVNKISRPIRWIKYQQTLRLSYHDKPCKF